MSDSMTFDNVTQTIWTCVMTTSEQEQGTTYTGPVSGTATTKTIVGTVVLSYNFNATASTVSYTIVDKPFIVPASQIWNGIQTTINGCQSGS